MLNPARAKSCTVASCREPLGMPSLSFIAGRFQSRSSRRSLRLRPFQRLEEAGSLAGVADVAVTLALHLQQHRVVVAIGEHFEHFEAVAGRLAFHPELVPGAAEEGGKSGCLR